MAEVVIKTRENGPLLVTGPITLIDHRGQKYDVSGQANVALCRCGGSKKRPFCDGSHKTNGFEACELAPLSPSVLAQQQQQQQ
jgi:CDGSH-type Zn-finger protein